MLFLVILRRRTEAFSDAQFAEVLGIEAERARALYAEGHFRSLHSRGDVPGAVITVEAPDQAEATRLAGTLPFAERGMAELQVIPLRPYRGFIGG